MTGVVLFYGALRGGRSPRATRGVFNLQRYKYIVHCLQHGAANVLRLELPRYSWAVGHNNVIKRSKWSVANGSGPTEYIGLLHTP